MGRRGCAHGRPETREQDLEYSWSLPSYYSEEHPRFSRTRLCARLGFSHVDAAPEKMSAEGAAAPPQKSHEEPLEKINCCATFLSAY
jgi:hypothetical protein